MPVGLVRIAVFDSSGAAYGIAFSQREWRPKL